MSTKLSDEKILPPNSHYPLFEEKDPSKLLVELDKGLRSPSVGEQCESIIFFSKLIAKYPFPIIVNTTLLKLSELFRTGNNIVRYCILKVFKEQGKVYNIKFNQTGEESTQRLLLQRLLQPLHSNDPIARALTLRTLGSMSDFIGEDLALQHNIRNCLSSNHPQEVEAAIFAIDRVCSRSPIFARSILPSLSQMIRGLNCTSKIKLKLIEVLRHMKYDVPIIKDAKEILQFALEYLSAQSFVVVSIHTLTVITQSSLSDISDHILLLFRYLKDDPRLSVKIRAIKDLKMLISKARFHIPISLLSCNIPSLFPYLSVDIPVLLRKHSLLLLLSISSLFLSPTPHNNRSNNNNAIINNNNDDDEMKIESFDHRSLSQLSGLAVNDDHISEDVQQRIFQTCSLYLYDQNVVIAKLAARVVSFYHSDHHSSIVLSLCSVLSFEIFAPHPSISSPDISGDTIKLIKLFVPLTRNNFDAQKVAINYLFSVLFRESPSLHVEYQIPILRVINNIVENAEKKFQLIHPHFSPLFSFLLRPPFTPQSSKLITIACGLFFNSYEKVWAIKHSTSSSSSLQFDFEEFNRKVMELAHVLKRHEKNWEIFLIAKMAAVRAFHVIAADLFQSISDQVQSPHFYYFLVSLSKISISEYSVVSSSLFNSIFMLNDALTALRASKLKNCEHSFQEQFLILRTSYLTSMMNLSADYPIIIATNGSKGIIENFTSLSLQLHAFRHSYFDIDHLSFSILFSLQSFCSLIAKSASLLLTPQNNNDNNDDNNNNNNNNNINNNHPHYNNNSFVSSASPRLIIHDKANRSDDSSSSSSCYAQLSVDLSEKLREVSNYSFSNEEKGELFSKIIQQLLTTPLPYPPYFYQTKPTMTIQLTIYPQPPSPGKPILCSVNSGLILTISGILLNSEPKKKFRKVSQILLEVITIPGFLDSINYEKKLANYVGSLELLTTPSNESFTTTCLMQFPKTSEKYTLVVNCIIIDRQNVRWYAKKNTFVHVLVN